MTATNHVVTGALIGTVVINPWLAIPAAFLAHFVLDSLPHYGVSDDEFKTRGYMMKLGLDMSIAATVLITLLVIQPLHWQVMILCGIACSSPDLMWLPHYLRIIRKKRQKRLNIIEKFHKEIQWGERSWGIVIEMVWFMAILTVILGRYS